MSHKVVFEIDKNGFLKCDWWTKDIAELFCSICHKNGTSECDKIVCTVANPWCG